MCFCFDDRQCFLGRGVLSINEASPTSCLLNSSCSVVTGPWLVNVDGEFERGAERDDTELCDVGLGSITSCLGVDAITELTNVVVPSSWPTSLIFCAFLHTLFLLVSVLCGVINPAVFMACAVKIRPSEAAKSCAAIRSFSSTIIITH